MTTKGFTRISSLLLSVAMAATVGLLWYRHCQPVELSIAFLERNFPEEDPARMQRSELFETLHRRTLENLVRDFNHGNRRFRLRLLPRDAMPSAEASKDKAKYQAYLTGRYDRLAKMERLIAVFDNCWGSDIQPRAKELSGFPSPIVFLNADHDHLDFGKARIFVGNSDQVPEEISAILPEVFAQIKGPDALFITEEDYALGKRFSKVFQDKGAPMNEITEVAMKSRSTDRMYLAAKRAEIISHLLKEDGWKAMQKRPKLVILNAHSTLGEEMVPWLDETFQNLTVIGYQSMLSRSPGFNFGRGNNELILLSNSTQTIPEDLFLRFRRLSEDNLEAFKRNDAVFFVRRCVVAMDVTLSAVTERNWPESDPFLRLRSQLSHSWERYRSKNVRGTLGEYAFSSEGELLGQNHFLLYKDHKLSSYHKQLRYVTAEVDKGDEGAGPKETIEAMIRTPVTNVHCGVRNVHLRDIDITQGSMHAELDYWMREHQDAEPAGPPSSASMAATKPDGATPPKLSTLLPIDFKPDTLVDESLGNFGQRLLATKSVGSVRQRTLHLSGTFNKNLNGWMYPFDKHHLEIELQAWNADRTMRLSRGDFMEEQAPEADGWNVGDWYLSLNSRETNPVPISSDSQAGDSSQYDILTLGLDVKRRLWNSLLLLFVPLALLVFASVAVLFIKFAAHGAGDKDGGDEHAGQVDFEERKTQTELSIGSVLAVITYLISYATLVPRLQTLIYSDLLVGLSLGVAVFNFVFVVAVRARKSNRFVTWLSLEHYRRISCGVAGLGFVAWLVVGLMSQG